MTKISLAFFAIINTSSKRAGESRRYSCSIATDNNRAQAALNKGHLLRPKNSAIKAWEEESKDAGKHKMMKLRSTQNNAEKHKMMKLRSTQKHS